MAAMAGKIEKTVEEGKLGQFDRGQLNNRQLVN